MLRKYKIKDGVLIETKEVRIGRRTISTNIKVVGNDEVITDDIA